MRIVFFCTSVVSYILPATLTFLKDLISISFSVVNVHERQISLSKLNSKESIFLNLVGVSTDKHLLCLSDLKM